MTKSKDRLPLVSIIIPSYNHAKLISKSIDSVINQTYTNLEIIVIDDGSTDNSINILKELQLKFGFILKFQKNHGISYTLNRAIKEFATGKYVSICSSDDYYHPQKIEKQVKYLEEHSNIPMCYCMTEEVGFDGRINENTNNNKLKGGYIFKDILLQKFHPPVTHLFRKEIFNEVGFYREDILTEDYLMNLRVSFKHPVGFIPEKLYYYRVGSSAPKNKDASDYRYEVSQSHLKCILEFKKSNHFSEAIKEWNYRNFRSFAPYKKYKLNAITALFYCVRCVFRLKFWKSFSQLIFSWK